MKLKKNNRKFSKTRLPVAVLLIICRASNSVSEDENIATPDMLLGINLTLNAMIREGYSVHMNKIQNDLFEIIEQLEKDAPDSPFTPASVIFNLSLDLLGKERIMEYIGFKNYKSPCVINPTEAEKNDFDYLIKSFEKLYGISFEYVPPLKKKKKVKVKKIRDKKTVKDKQVKIDVKKWDRDRLVRHLNQRGTNLIKNARKSKSIVTFEYKDSEYRMNTSNLSFFGSIRIINELLEDEK